MENKKCSKPPTRFYTPEKYFAEGPTFLLRPHQRFCVVPPKAAPPFQTCSWMAFFSKTAETQTLLHGPRISNLHGTWRMIPLGNWTQVPEVGCLIYKWVIKSGWWFQPL